tara:strand:- start:280 stop:477 length:198 start_codon:yes stop_codon:yes gene_type:complete
MLRLRALGRTDSLGASLLGRDLGRKDFLTASRGMSFVSFLNSFASFTAASTAALSTFFLLGPNRI